MKTKKYPREYKIPSRNMIRGEILHALYETIMEIQTRKIMTKVEVFDISGSGKGGIFKQKPSIKVITWGTNNPVAVCDIFDYTGHIEGGNINSYKFIRNFMKGMMDDLDKRKELFNLINFDGAKVVQVTGEILELDRPNLTYMLCTLYGAKICFSDIVNMEFVKNIFRGSNLVH